MKSQADENRMERVFEVGHWVYVKLQPHIQQSVQRRSNNKLSYKYFGPYLVLQRVGAVAYKLQLAASSQIHPVIHVSQLKKALPPNTPVATDDELHLLHSFQALPFEQVLDSHLQLVGNHVIKMDLVQRQSCPSHWASWEPKQPLHQPPSTTKSATRRRRCTQAASSSTTSRGRAAP